MFIATVIAALASASPVVVPAAGEITMRGTDRYCVRASRPETALAAGTQLHMRECRSAKAWKLRGVEFGRRG